jgi:hypothetical protein
MSELSQIPADLAAAMASLTERVTSLEVGIDALDRGVVDTGQTAAEAIAKASTIEHDQDALNRQLIDTEVHASHAVRLAEDLQHSLNVLTEVFGHDGGRDWTPHRGDPVVARVQARRKRIAASGLTLVRGSGGAACAPWWSTSPRWLGSSSSASSPSW